MRQRKDRTSAGNPIRVAWHSIVYTFSSMIVVWLIGTAIAVAYRQGEPQDGDLWLTFLISLIPWVILLLQLVNSTTRGIDESFPKPTPTATAQKDYRLDQIPIWLQDEPRLNGVFIIDHIYFIERIVVSRDWTQRTWEGVQMPSGMICDRDYHRKLVTTLTSKGFIVGYKPRSTGRLICSDKEKIINHLKLPQLLGVHQSDFRSNQRYKLA